MCKKIKQSERAQRGVKFHVALSRKYPLIFKKRAGGSDKQVMWAARIYRKQMDKGLEL